MTEELFVEVLAAAVNDNIAEATDGERAAWVSSAMGLWREPGVAEDPSADDLAFVEWLSHSKVEAAAELLAAVASIADGVVGEAARIHVEPLDLPEIGDAWILGNQVKVLSFVHCDGDEVLLVDIDNGALSDVHLATGAEELIDSAAEGVEVQTADPYRLAAEISDALGALAENPVLPTDGLLSNMALLRARLRQLEVAAPDPVWLVEFPTPLLDSEADRSSLETLEASIPELLLAPAPTGAESMVAKAANLVRWNDGSGWPIQELEGLASLEWADWLGVTLGLGRGGAGSRVSPSILVDLINRTPEVTSTIPKSDRGWYEWVFAIVIESWSEIGIVDPAGRLTDAGRWALPKALVVAWS